MGHERIFSVFRRAAKSYRCGDCGGPINRGDRYRESRIPPGFDVLSNDEWWRARYCSPCATRYVAAATPEKER